MERLQWNSRPLVSDLALPAPIRNLICFFLLIFSAGCPLAPFSASGVPDPTRTERFRGKITVLDRATGEPLPKAYMQVIPGRFEVIAHAYTNEYGEVAFNTVYSCPAGPPRKLTFWITLDGYTTLRQIVNADEFRANVGELRSAKRITVYMRRGRGKETVRQDS